MSSSLSIHSLGNGRTYSSELTSAGHPTRQSRRGTDAGNAQAMPWSRRRALRHTPLPPGPAHAHGAARRPRGGGGGCGAVAGTPHRRTLGTPHPRPRASHAGGGGGRLCRCRCRRRGPDSVTGTATGMRMGRSVRRGRGQGRPRGGRAAPPLSSLPHPLALPHRSTGPRPPTEARRTDTGCGGPLEGAAL